MNRDEDRPFADFTLERFALGELSVSERAGLERRLEHDGALRERLDELERSDDEIRGRHLPEQLAEQVQARLRDGRRAERHPRHRRPWLALAAAAGTVGVLLAGVWPRVFAPGRGGDITSRDAGLASEVRLKGQPPGLTLFRKGVGGSEVLGDGDVARPGDLIRLGYQSAGRSYGVIFSVDGRGTVTRHLPHEGERAAPLQSGGTVLLDEAYELDDAPRWERFYFVTGGAPFELAPLVEQAQRAAASGALAPTLALPAHLDQFTLSVKKGSAP